jgi:hypothetical protein
MIKLETEFVSGVDGYSQSPGPLTYKQLQRTDTVALYQRNYADGRIKDFEVFRIKILPKGTKVFETITEDDQEKYPGASQFGFSAWSLINLSHAIVKYNEICQVVVDKTLAAESKKEFIIPVQEFTTGEFAEINSVNYITASNFIKSSVNAGKIIFLRDEQRNAKGKPSKIFSSKTS